MSILWQTMGFLMAYCQQLHRNALATKLHYIACAGEMVAEVLSHKLFAS